MRLPPRSTLFPYTTLFRSEITWTGMAAVRASCFRRSNKVHPLISGSRDRKSTRLNSSHVSISYAVFCLKKKRVKFDVLNQNDFTRLRIDDRVFDALFDALAVSLSEKFQRSLVTRCGYHRDLHSFPTRRSSDLKLRGQEWQPSGRRASGGPTRSIRSYRAA